MLQNKRFSQLAATVAVLFYAASLWAAPATRSLFIRATLLAPDNNPWRLHLVSHQPGGKSKSLFAGKTAADNAKATDFLPAGQATEWLDLSQFNSSSGCTLRFIFE